MNVNMVSWFEVPVVDMDRAKAFYETVFDIEITVHQMGDLIMGWFPAAESANASGATGSLVKNKNYVPSEDKGVVIYFNTLSGDIANELSRVEAAGGKLIQDKTLISETVGYMGLFLDSEGNRMAIYSK